MSTADQVERYVGRAAKTTARVDIERTGKHRAETRARLGLHRLFYVARHRTR